MVWYAGEAEGHIVRSSPGFPDARCNGPWVLVLSTAPNTYMIPFSQQGLTSSNMLTDPNHAFNFEYVQWRSQGGRGCTGRSVATYFWAGGRDPGASPGPPNLPPKLKTPRIWAAILSKEPIFHLKNLGLNFVPPPSLMKILATRLGP